MRNEKLEKEFPSPDSRIPPPVQTEGMEFFDYKVLRELRVFVVNICLFESLTSDF
ncbi:MAG: hypothetical protein K8T10_10495 [Candidatus Eremiobacteraeota bacterium]|nr:hypothetical protein [Candidatus Eremiobacteraeota bacterium]